MPSNKYILLFRNLIFLSIYNIDTFFILIISYLANNSSLFKEPQGSCSLESNYSFRHKFSMNIRVHAAYCG